MDFFDLIFGNGVDSKPSSQKNGFDSSIDPVEQYVKESIANLKEQGPLTTEKLEAEAIYLAAFLYLKDTYQIDFELDYLSDGLLDRIPSGNFSVCDKVFNYVLKYGEGHYGVSERDYGLNGYKMNIQLCPDYGSYIKNYFMRAHKIGSSNDYIVFSSPRNCLWRDGQKSCDSPTHRDVYYKFDGNTFEFIIPPYNPLVTGTMRKIDNSTLRCQSSDGRRTFVFHYDGDIRPELLNYIEMYRNDKGDMVTYHRE